MSMPLAAMAVLGGVLLQLFILGIHPDIAVEGGLWPRPPSIRTYTEGEARLLAVHQQLSTRDEFLVEIDDRLEQAQQHYKLHYDRKHCDIEFQVGDWVWLHLLHHPIASLSIQGRSRLDPCFFRPFQVLAHVSDIAY
jgi:hypothetical protein